MHYDTNLLSWTAPHEGLANPSDTPCQSIFSEEELGTNLPKGLESLPGESFSGQSPSPDPDRTLGRVWERQDFLMAVCNTPAWPGAGLQRGITSYR